MSEDRKEHWLKFLGVMLATFIGAFLAFYCVVDITVSRMMDPSYHMKKIEKIMNQTEKQLDNYDDFLSEHPFEPKLPPMLVNLVKEANEYKIIVDLKHIGNNENNVKFNINNNVITISGEVEKKEHHRENIMNFSQSYSLDEKLKSDEITKERKGNKYVITIPFED